MKLIILAAGKSSRIYSKIKINKCLIKINNKTLIENIIDKAHKVGIKKIQIVTGFEKENIYNQLKNYRNIFFLNNSKYKTTDMVYSCMLGLRSSYEDVLICYSDIFFEKDIFEKIKKNKSKFITVPSNIHWRKIWKLRNKSIFKDAETFIKKKNQLIELGNKINKKNLKNINGQFMGIVYIPKNKLCIFRKVYNEINKEKIQFTNFLNFFLIKGETIKTFNYKKLWFEIDDLKDLKSFKKFII